MWMTYKEVADYLKVSVSAVRKWVREGKLKAYRLSYRTVRFKKEDIDVFIEGRMRTRRGRKPSLKFPL